MSRVCRAKRIADRFTAHRSYGYTALLCIKTLGGSFTACTGPGQTQLLCYIAITALLAHKRCCCCQSLVSTASLLVQSKLQLIQDVSQQINGASGQAYSSGYAAGFSFAAGLNADPAVQDLHRPSGEC